jgi:hypothetical protein
MGVPLVVCNIDKFNSCTVEYLCGVVILSGWVFYSIEKELMISFLDIFGGT